MQYILAKQSGKSNILIYSKRSLTQVLSARLAACLPVDPVPLGADLQIFYKLCTVASDLQIS